MNERTVLVVDDHADIRNLVSEYLKAGNFCPVCACDGREALSVLERTEVDLVILDLNMPGCDGFEVCRQIRRDSAVPILVLSARSEDLDKILMLELGADDYLTKPFSFVVLTARIRALLRRIVAERPAVLSVGDLALDPVTRTVSRGQTTIELTPREFVLLEYLMRNRGRVLSKSELLDHVWDANFEGPLNVVEVYVGYLRKKIDTPFGTQSIVTVRGFGYRLDDTTVGSRGSQNPT